MDKEIFCINCGHINDYKNVHKCEICGYNYNIKNYRFLMEYAFNAVRYGYEYREEYEEQIDKYGEVNLCYSLAEPETLYGWLALAALSGIVGSSAFEIVRYVARQIYRKLELKNKETDLNDKREQILEFLSNEESLTRFSSYIQDYYNDLSNIKDEVKKAIISEEIADFAAGTPEESKELRKLVHVDKDKYLRLSVEISLKAPQRAAEKRAQKPSRKQLQIILKALKNHLNKNK